MAVLGAGPAGLSCAHDLALGGFAVTVFEAQDRAGGMLVLGIPEYRLSREVVGAEIAAIAALGVEIRLNQKLGHDYLLCDLRAEGYEAVFLAIGAHKSRELEIEGVTHDGVLRAIDYLLNINLGYRVMSGEKVVVIGGGNVAFDVARTALRRPEGDQEVPPDGTGPRASMGGERTEGEEIRLALDVARAAVRKGVPEVHMYCLESSEEMLADPEEIEEAKREGIQIHHRWGPRRILGDEKQGVTGIELVRCRSVFDAGGRFHPVFEPDSHITVACDTAILAIGQVADLSWRITWR